MIFYWFNWLLVQQKQSIESPSSLLTASPHHILNRPSSLQPSRFNNSSHSFHLPPFVRIRCLPLLVSLSLGNFACCSRATLPPFSASSIHSLALSLTLIICFAHSNTPPPPSHSLQPSLPLSLQLVVYSFSTLFCLPGRLTEREIG